MPLIAGLLAQAAVATGAAGGAILTKEGLAGMTPAAIADAVLPRGHPPVSVIGVHPAGMEPPSASPTAIDLRYVAAAARVPDFCAATVVRVPLTAVDPAINAVANATPVKPGTPSEHIVYRWTDRPDKCSAGAQATRRSDHQVQDGYFQPPSDADTEAFAIVRRLAAARSAARRPGKLPFTVTFGNRNPEIAAPGGNPANPRAALSALAVEWVNHVGPGRSFADWQGETPPAGETWWGARVNRDLVWTIRLRLRDDMLVGIDMTREIPPPF